MILGQRNASYFVPITHEVPDILAFNISHSDLYAIITTLLIVADTDSTGLNWKIQFTLMLVLHALRSNEMHLFLSHLEFSLTSVTNIVPCKFSKVKQGIVLNVHGHNVC